MVRKPKSEIRIPKEIRNPKSEFHMVQVDGLNSAEALRAFSDFGLRSSFGFRISDFGFHLTLRRQGARRKTVQATRRAQALGGFVHGTEQQVFAAGRQTEARAFGGDEVAGEFRERSEGFVGRSARQAT